jgi:hypothetical protein
MYPSIGTTNFQEKILEYDEFHETAESKTFINNLEDFIQVRESSCVRTDFKINKQQLWIKRFLSPWTPYKSAILVHGTGIGKSCTAIGIAEEFIASTPQSKVIVIASADVQENFKSEIFNINKVSINPPWNSSQCTGNTYIKRVQRLQRSLLNLSSKDDRSILDQTARKIIDDHYDFFPYMAWANSIINKQESLSKSAFKNWVQDNFNNKLIIVDEAHNSRPSQASNEKKVEQALRLITKEANNMNLVLLTATPMYNEWTEILWLLNLCIWNDKRIDLFKSLKDYEKGLSKDIFNDNLEFSSNDMENLFRNTTRSYISFIKGNNPFQFPFRLEPPIVLDNTQLPKLDIYGKSFSHRLNMKLVPSLLMGAQLDNYKKLLKNIPIDSSNNIDNSLEEELSEADDIPNTIITKIFAAGNIFLPEGNFYRSFQIKYNPVSVKYNFGSPRFFDNDNIMGYAAKFKTIIDAINNSDGICFIYSTYNLDGIFPLILALENYGYHPYLDNKGIWDETPPEKKTKGAYVVFSGNTKLFPKQLPIEELKNISKEPSNKNGQKIKIIIGSKKVSEGLDFANIRQIHILEPWYNTSLLDQVIGRGLRTCSHSMLPFEKQNCTVYLHSSILPPELGRETIDLTAYRLSEQKALGISKILHYLKESSFDCITHYHKNHLDNKLLNLSITQSRSQDNIAISGSIEQFTKPLFDYEPTPECESDKKPEDIQHHSNIFTPTRFLTDRQDDLIDALRKLFHINYSWIWNDIINRKELKGFNQKSISLILDEIVRLPNQYPFIDKLGRKGIIERRSDIYAFIPMDIRFIKGATTFERTQPLLHSKQNLEIENKKQKQIIKEPSDIQLLEQLTSLIELEKQSLLNLGFDSNIINQNITQYAFDKLNINTRFKLFIQLLKNNSIGIDINLYSKLVSPRLIQLNYPRDGIKQNVNLALIINPEGLLQYIIVDDNNIDLNKEPSVALQTAINIWESQFRRDFILSNRAELEGLTELNTKSMKFINKIFVNKEDFRGHDCTTFKKNEIDNYLKQINFKPSLDYKRDEVCKGIDISIRTLSSNDTEGKYKYILPEFRHILTPLRQKDFDELLKKKK